MRAALNGISFWVPKKGLLWKKRYLSVDFWHWTKLRLRLRNRARMHTGDIEAFCQDQTARSQDSLQTVTADSLWIRSLFSRKALLFCQRKCRHVLSAAECPCSTTDCQSNFIAWAWQPSRPRFESGQLVTRTFRVHRQQTWSFSVTGSSIWNVADVHCTGLRVPCLSGNKLPSTVPSEWKCLFLNATLTDHWFCGSGVIIARTKFTPQHPQSRVY